MARISRTTDETARDWATKNVGAHSKNFTSAFAAHFGMTRAGAAPAIKQLERDGYILRTGSGTRPLFLPGPNRFLQSEYPLPGVDENHIWERDFSPWLDMPANVKNIVHYGFTEIVNNANDHSGGSILNVIAYQRDGMIAMAIIDDGIGIFRRISDAFNLPDIRLALLELSKGKLTSDPTRHSGEGLFFTSRAFDDFHLYGNGLEYSRVMNEGIKKLEKRTDPERLDPFPETKGTTVFVSADCASKLELKTIFDQFTTGAPDDLSFDKTVVPVKLARLGQENLLSRSQAKRLLSGIDRFKVVELDFSGITEIGQAFADEIFRVYSNSHPEIKIIPVSTNPDVRHMINRVLSNIK
jgi:anti-sigma regulatory factor (Ser/Thr protein kinase)